MVGALATLFDEPDLSLGVTRCETDALQRSASDSGWEQELVTETLPTSAASSPVD